MATNEDVNIPLNAEDIEQAIFTFSPASESILGVGSENITVRNVSDYEELDNLPQINDVTLIGNRSFEELGAESLSNLEIESIINSVV